jgi:HAD superfamily hydrolase (TIGR01509 family)
LKRRPVIEAILFDFDGLILDTEFPEFTAWSERYSDFGLSLAVEDWAARIGCGASTVSQTPYEHIEELLGRPIDHDQVRAAKRARVAELIASERILPGVEALITAAQARGVRLGVVSSSVSEWVNGFLAKLNLLDRFDLVLSGDDVARAKPEPDLYLAALSLLDVSAANAVALEDSRNGIAAAKAAGIFCVAVPNRLTRHTSLAQADIQVESLEEIPLDRLIHVAGRSAGNG